jgi:hypothetical protein
MISVLNVDAQPISYPRGLRPFAGWDCEFESRRGHGYLYFVIFVCRQVEVSFREVLQSVVCPIIVITKHRKEMTCPGMGSKRAKKKKKEVDE